jgi:hypothetical protein
MIDRLCIKNGLLRSGLDYNNHQINFTGKLSASFKMFFGNLFARWQYPLHWLTSDYVRP